MKQIIKCFQMVIITIVAIGSAFAEQPKTEGQTFEACQQMLAGELIRYRKAAFEGEGIEGRSLVVYLHGGSSCGTDNTAQMSEAGIDSISHYLAERKLAALLVVPQCSDRNRGWGGMSQVVKALIDELVSLQQIDPRRIYILGGSMGGTGTWKLLSDYPNFFAAGMPCAANPKGMSATNVATTPVYSVMGLADRIMNAEVRATAEAFVGQLVALGDEAELETVEGWSHEATCIQSYSAERLDWLFAHQLPLQTGIETVAAFESSNEGRWFTLQGVAIDKPKSRGIYIHGGKKVFVK